jgi:hypothetical protein
MYKEPWPMFITGWIGEPAIVLLMIDLNARYGKLFDLIFRASTVCREEVELSVPDI